MFRVYQLATMIASLLLFTVSGVTHAGDFGPSPAPVPSFSLVSVDCTAVTVQFDEGSAFTNIRVNIDIMIDPDASDISPAFYEEIFATGNMVADTATFSFDPELTGATAITLTIELRTPGADFPFAGDTIALEIDCSEEDAPVIVTEANFIFGCNDGRLNQILCEPIAIYSVESDDGVGLHVWEIDRQTSEGTPSLYLAAEALAAAFAEGTETFCALAVSEDERTGVYLQPDGELLVVYGPDFESKFFVFTFESYPGMPVPSTYFGNSLPAAPECS